MVKKWYVIVVYVNLVEDVELLYERNVSKRIEEKTRKMKQIKMLEHWAQGLKG